MHMTMVTRRRERRPTRSMDEAPGKPRTGSAVRRRAVGPDNAHGVAARQTSLSHDDHLFLPLKTRGDFHESVVGEAHRDGTLLRLTGYHHEHAGLSFVIDNGGARDLQGLLASLIDDADACKH